MIRIIANGLACALLVTVSACGGGGGGSTPTTPPSSPTATAPAITTQPTAQSVTLGQPATFTVTASGTAPLSYQWQENGNAISGATAATYTTAATVATDNAATFAVVVTNSAGSVTSSSVTLTVNNPAPAATAPTITTQPSNVSVQAGATATFTVAAAGTAPLTYQWQRAGTAIPTATGATYTTGNTVLTDNGATFTVVVTNSAGTVTSSAATLTVTAPPASNGIDVTTYKYDTLRSGQNIAETVLTLANVNQATFGKLGVLNTDGRIDAQPLFLSQLTVGGAAHNVMFVETEHGSVYAFDANTQAQLWQVSLVPTGQTTAPFDTSKCDVINPEVGITSTPVIDRTAGAHGVMYVEALSMDTANTYHHFLHALDITTGADVMPATEITATFTDVNSHVTNFDPSQALERSALLLANGTVYLTWASFCDGDQNNVQSLYGGWVTSYDQATLTQNGVLNVGPGAAYTVGQTLTANATVGPGFWSGGSGPALDPVDGTLYVLTGNGPFDTTLDSDGSPINGNYGQSFLRLQPAGAAGGGLRVYDYFSLNNNNTESNADLDLGSGGGLLLPPMTASDGTTKNMYIAAGKDGNIYIVEKAKFGGFHAAANHNYQQVNTVFGANGVFGSPAYFNGNLYFGPKKEQLQAFKFTNALISTAPTSMSATTFAYPGTSPSVSANGTANGIVWAAEKTAAGAAVLHAYDATNLATELYNSTQAAAGARDSIGLGSGFTVPIVSGGQVFVVTNSGVGIFGLLP